jgi:hypothetical protein
MATKKKLLAAALAIIALMTITVVVALLQSSKTIPSSGTIYAYKVVVYANSGLTNQLDKINWTTVNPGGSTTQTIYVKNEAGNLNMILSMEITGWSPTPANTTNVVYFGWNQTGTTLTPGQSTTALVSMVVPDNSETQTGLSFDVSIRIIGTETT